MGSFKEYGNSTQEFINSQPIQYVIDLYEEQGISSTCEDGKITSWKWETK